VYPFDRPFAFFFPFLFRLIARQVFDWTVNVQGKVMPDASACVLMPLTSSTYCHEIVSVFDRAYYRSINPRQIDRSNREASILPFLPLCAQLSLSLVLLGRPLKLTGTWTHWQSFPFGDESYSSRVKWFIREYAKYCKYEHPMNGHRCN
jgi:hypothetical protein